MSSTASPAVAGRPSRARLLLAAHAVLVGAFLVVLALYLGRMTAAGVGPAEMTSGAYDPKDLVPFGMSGLNPFAWLYLVVSLLYLSGVVIGPALALYTAVVVWRDRSVRPRVLLITAAIVTLTLTVLRLSQLLDDVHQWWLD